MEEVVLNSAQTPNEQENLTETNKIACNSVNNGRSLS